LSPAPKPVTRAREDRFVVLVGKYGLSGSEASGACGFSPSTGDRIARARRAEINALRGSSGAAADDPGSLLRALVEFLRESDEQAVREAADRWLVDFADQVRDLPDAARPDDIPSFVTRFPHPDYEREPE
jgi:hypothetical protein